MSLTPLEKAASGALASAFANSLVYPLDLGKTLIQTQVHTHSTKMGKSDSISSSSLDEDSQTLDNSAKKELKYKNTIDALRTIYKKKGILGWYQGLASSVFGTATQNFAYFYWYTIVKRVYSNLYKHIPNHKPGTAMELFLGALAAAISQLFTMPIGVITTQHQTDKTSRSIFELTKETIEHDGVSGLWKGLKVSLVLCINPSITYGSYERLKQIFFANKTYLGPLESFTLGVFAKSLATVITQPLIVSKAILQKKTHRAKPGEKIPDNEPFEEDIKFNHFTEALSHLWETEKFRGLYKGIAPQLVKGVFVQGLLFMFKDQIDLFFVFLLQLVKQRKKRLLR